MQKHAVLLGYALQLSAYRSCLKRRVRDQGINVMVQLDLAMNLSFNVVVEVPCRRVAPPGLGFNTPPGREKERKVYSHVFA